MTAHPGGRVSSYLQDRLLKKVLKFGFVLSLLSYPGRAFSHLYMTYMILVCC